MTIDPTRCPDIPVRQVTPGLFVGPQLQPDQLAAIRAAGFASVINNRPDLEGGADQPMSQALEAAAQASGLAYRYLPVPPQNQESADATRMMELVNELPGPVYAFCRTGNRAAALYRKGLPPGA